MKLPIIVSYALIALFVLVALLSGNGEFIFYGLVLLPFIVLIHLTDKHFDYRLLGLWGLGVWILSHLLGGFASIGDVRLYDFMLLNLVGEPYLILKYDQFVHFFCYVVMAYLLGSVVEKVAKPKASTITLGILLALAASGIGAFNEIIEFVPVVLLNNQGVGGYYNTVIDIIANFLGAITGSWLYFRRR